MYEWVIIGGGVHATTIALQLKDLGLPVEKLKIIDPHSQLMANFNRQTKRLGMQYLRSPLVHHCHPNAFDLKYFSKKEDYAQPTIGHYQRPRLDMFMNHTLYWIRQHHLEECHICQKAKNIEQHNHQWRISLNHNQDIIGKNVVLAMGTHDTPYIPKIFKNQPDVQHIHQHKINLDVQASHVVGSGISAAHLAIKLVKQSKQCIHLWIKKPFEVHDFDADPGWLGPKNMNNFNKETQLQRRIEINRQERHKGSLPRDLFMQIKHYEKQGKIIIHNTPIERLENHHIISQESSIKYDGIFLATGFSLDLMKQPLIQDLIQKYQAPLIQGFPVINESLEWLPNIYVSGMLADLELGPFARNIMGGRQAAKKIAQVYTSQNPS
ncbi:NAD(P)-binding domain-containing protein [Staphylococcus sp. 11261D007BR]